MRRWHWLWLALCCAAVCSAHEGEAHHDAQPASPLPAAALAERPHRLPDGSLYVPKAAQHLLGIRTQPWSGEAGGELTLWAEVQPQPAAAVTIAAPGPGQLEAADRPWPLPGETVRAGEVLAWLKPQIPQREAARRRAEVADLDQKLVISDINVQRLSLQDNVNDTGKTATGNIYYEQAKAQRDALQRQRELVAQSLQDRVALRAEVPGRVVSAPLRAGDVVASGQVLFELADPAKQRLSAPDFDPTLGARLRAASARFASGETALAYLGQEPLAGAPGWRLLFEAQQGGIPLAPGQLVEIRARLASAAPPPEACTPAADGATVWVHRSPERFVPLRLGSCAAAADLQLARGDRLVTQGAGLLSQYR
jgi:membrane fusion protein, heavy metal efflux system